MNTESKAPSAFISYSHDSVAHRDWVRALAERLTSNGIHVVLDQWDLSLGAELTRFMERSLAECDFVILICTEMYAEKANERTGGVGYETTMLSNLLLAQAPIASDGRSRVILVVRQTRKPAVLPRFAGSRLYVDLSDGTAESNFDDLLRALHNVPRHVRPPMGANPYAGSAQPRTSPSLATPSESTRALTRAFRSARADGIASLSARQPQFAQMAGATADQRHDELILVLRSHESYLRLLLETTQGGRLTADLFAEEIESVVKPKGWISSGMTRVVELPYAIGWAAHHLIGAALLESGKAGEAVRFARESIQVGSDARQTVFAIARLTGWPIASGTSNEAWGSLRRLPEKFPWMTEAFGDTEEYWISTIAHQIALNFTEFLSRVQCGPNFDTVRQDREHAPKIPLYFWTEDSDLQRGAYRMLIRDLPGLVSTMGLRVSIPNLRDLWSMWLRFQEAWISIESGGSAIGRAPHSELMNDLLSARA
jgi:hypothetical protein